MNPLRLIRALRLAVKNLGQYKLRAGLTVLGIVFGVCSVVAMLSVGEGASVRAREQIRRLGSENILLKSMKLPQEQQSGGQTSGRRMADYGLRYEDLDRILRMVPNIQAVTSLKRLTYDVKYRDKRMETQMIATEPWYPVVTRHRMLAGRFFTQEDMDSGAMVCVIGARLARQLFPGVDPIDKLVRSAGDNVFRVIGVIGDHYSAEGLRNKPLWFVGENDNLFVPLSSYRQRQGDVFVKFGEGEGTMEKVELHEIIVTLKSERDVMPAAARLRGLLRERHERQDYEIVVPLQLLEQAKETQRLFNIVLGSIAAISLIVGGIGIMNIMLATVSERTREIGIRRALGARRRDIVLQFLIETTVLSVFGGLVGMLLGALIPALVTASTKLQTVQRPAFFLIAFGVSVGVGLVFGIYPARRAARMDPIEALRHE